MALRADLALLISPYWNVNALFVTLRGTRIELLISPYWNVNTGTVKPVATWVAAFNLSILECKSEREVNTPLFLLRF